MQKGEEPGRSLQYYMDTKKGIAKVVEYLRDTKSCTRDG